ncbi:MAG: His/Gly/Thr/Pro-type tRNA ligase C-terminal domain-containing protein [bacterium]
MKKQQQKIQKEYANKEKAYTIAQYYGFEGIFSPEITKADESIAKTLKKPHPENTEQELRMPSIESRISLVRHYLEGTLTKETQPAIVYYETAGTKRGSKNINLNILGSTKSIAEATLIKATLAILKEYGHKNLSIEINSVGEKDSISRFSKEIVNYFKKNLGALSAPLRQKLAKDPFLFINEENEKLDELKESMPQVISYLNDITKSHFKEVLEFLECMNIPYRINNCLVGNRAYSNNTIFKIIENADTKLEKVLACGSRYNGLSKKAGIKRDVPAVSVVVFINHPKDSAGSNKINQFSKAKFYFIQFGFEAKLKSLEIIDTLREAKISVSQSLSKDKLSAQLGSAEAQNFPYLLIVGQKEAMDNTVLVRYKDTRSQAAVKVKDLVEYIKKLP